MFCPTCGNQLPDKSTFCPTCGAMGASVIKVSVLIPYRKGEKWGYIDTKGKLVIPAVYEDATVIIGLNQNPITGRRFSPNFFVYLQNMWRMGV